MEEEGKIVEFWACEEERFKNVFSKYSQSYLTDSHSAEEILRAADRLIQATKEIIRRRTGIYTRYGFTNNMYKAWEKAYLAQLRHYEREYKVLGEMVEGRWSVDHITVRSYSLAAGDLYRKALKETQKVSDQLKLSQDEVQKMRKEASAAYEAENWQPQ